MQLNNKDALLRIFDCAKLYQQYYSGRIISFVYIHGNEIHTIEVEFRDHHFRHLTGITTKQNINTAEFFREAVNKNLTESDIEITKKSMAEAKLSVLPEFLERPASSIKMIGEYNPYSKISLHTNILAGGVKSCMGFIKNDSNIYVPNTMLADDIMQLTTKSRHVVAMWGKNYYEKRYSEEIHVNRDKIDKSRMTDNYNSFKSDNFK